MSEPKTNNLFASVRDLIKEQDELEKKLPLESKFSRWPKKKEKHSRVYRPQPLDLTQEDIQEMTREDE